MKTASNQTFIQVGLLKNSVYPTYSPHRLEAYYDREALDLVNSLYAKDFELGAYEML